MKRKFSKILGVGLTLALITSLLLTAAPVSALTKPSVTVDDNTISVTTDYSIVTALGVRLGGTSTLSYTAGTTTVTVTAGTLTTANTFEWTALAGVTDPNDAVNTAGSITLGSGGTDTFTASAAAGDVVITLTKGSIASIIETTGTFVTISETALPTDSIIIEFDEDTDITGVVGANVTVAATSGIGTPAWGPETITIASVDIDDQELTIDVPLAIGVGAMIEVVVSEVENPDTAGDYTLDVSTTNEDAVTSSDFEIEVPTIGVLPGIVQVFNPTDILMNQFTGNNAITAAIAVAEDDYTIVVGPGEYESGTITITQEGLTLESSAGADDTIIDADGLGADVIEITVDDVTVDGFTIRDTASGDAAIMVTGDDATVTDNIFTAEDGYPEGIRITAAGATVSGNELDLYHTMMVIGATDSELSDNTFGAGINVDGSTGITITDNDLTGAELVGIRFGGSNCTDILIEGNTISEVTESTTAGDAGIGFIGTFTVDELQVIGNDITDNEGAGIEIPSTVTLTNSVIKFNTITGNNTETGDYAIQNDSGTDVDAAFNWWGTDVADDIADMVSDDVTYEPFLADTAEAVFSASEVAVGATSLDAKDTVGVRVSGATGATVISAAKYSANPQAAISDAIAFFDVYAAGVTDPDTTEVTIKLYAGDENSTLHIWSADTEAWAEREDADYSVYGGYMYDDVLAELLDGTVFVVVAGEAEADELAAPEIAAPDSGAGDVSLTPTFAWWAVADADGYYFEFADNANFVLPLAKLDGDTGRLIVTAYAYVGTLPYSTAYYWRVKAVSGTIDAGDLAQSDWASAVFITMDEPEEPVPPVVIEPTPPAPPAPIITIEQPDIIIPLPDVVETPITPSWIYVIIGVGAVLVIALLVLIVRTRRVA